MKIHACAQKEEEWLKLRIGKVTASEMNRLLTPKFKIKDGDGPRTYLYEKLAEAWRGMPLPGFNSFSSEYGELMEDEARKWYALEYDEPLRNVGFIEHDDGRCGCSPDALIGDTSGLELKCLQPTNHVRTLVENKLPDDHAVQVHASLYVTGFETWRFVSYRRGFPPFVLTIHRDEKILKQIEGAVASFHLAFTDAMQKLQDLSK